MKRFSIYFTWMAVIVVFLFVETRIEGALKAFTEATFRLGPGIVFAVLFPVFMGMLLRLPYLLKEIKDKGKWGLDWVKLCAVGIPFFYIVLNPIFLVFNMKVLMIQRLAYLITTSSVIMNIAGVVLGYIIIDSLKVRPVKTIEQDQPSI